MIEQKYTPNFTAGRKGYKAELFVIHTMAGSLKGTDNWFANPISKVSAHFGVGNNGEKHQYVKTEDTAWANGIVNNPFFKLYKPNVNPNLYTISIETEGYDLAVAPQTLKLAICELLIEEGKKWDISLDRDHVIGHYQIDGIRKPNCPSSDRTVIDQLLQMIQTKPTKEEVLKDLDTLRQKIVNL